MYFEVQQTKSGIKKLFDIRWNGQIIYKAETSWERRNVVSARKIEMFNSYGQKMLEAQYHLLDNTVASALPFKYLVTGEQKFSQFSIVDSVGNLLGAFYMEANGLLDQKIYLQYGDRFLVGYRRCMTTKEAISFYENDIQVGQITKSTVTMNNLDYYMVHFVQGYEDWIHVIAFGTVYCDFLYHDHTNEHYKGVRVQRKNSYDHNADKFNENFIAYYFGQQEAQRVDYIAQYGTPEQQAKQKKFMKMFWILFAGGWGIALLIAAIVFCVLYFG